MYIISDRRVTEMVKPKISSDGLGKIEEAYNNIINNKNNVITHI